MNVRARLPPRRIDEFAVNARTNRNFASQNPENVTLLAAFQIFPARVQHGEFLFD